MSTSSPNSPRFRVWIRRQSRVDGPFSIKFEVEEGKGVLRVARPGVLIDPPARPTGAEDRLTGAQLRASRFLHVWDNGRGRQGHSLTRLEESSLDRLPLENWVPLVPSEDSALHYLFLPDIAPEVEDEVAGDEPTYPRRILANLREDLSSLTIDDAIEAGSVTDEVPLDALPDEDEDAPPAEPTRLEALENPISHLVSAVPGAETVPPAEPSVLTVLSSTDADPANVTPLVRHLRRQVERQGSRILELEEEVRLLRARPASP